MTVHPNDDCCYRLARERIDYYQKDYLGHTEEIKCMAVHPNMMNTASGKPGEGNTITRGFT